jgi:RNA polymerase sigma factor (sigma-70 family)
MGDLAAGSVARQLGALFEGGSAAGLSDRQLLERFNARRDAVGEAAFAAIVGRHGPMVLGLCHQLLDDRHLAEDAFQAVFLVLARRAHSLRDPDLLGNWLYGVALRTSRCARIRLDRRRRAEEIGTPMRRDPGAPPADEAVAAREQAEALHVEIERLPAAFRLPVVLCYLEGLTVHEAARRLRCSHGTVRSRMARAREKLRRALTRRGVVLSGTAIAAALETRSASASVSSLLCDSTARAAIRFAAGPAVGEALAASTAALAQEVLRSMLIHKLRLLAPTVLILGALATGAGMLARSLASEDPPARTPAGPPPTSVAARPDVAAAGRMIVTGRVLDPDGKPVPGATVMVHAALMRLAGDDVYNARVPSVISQARGDGSGHFRMDATRTTSTQHHLVGAIAIAPGYGAGWVEFDPDADQPVADITLRPEQVIEGRLFDLSGQPVRGAEVSVQTMGRVVPAQPGSLLPESTKGPSFSPYRSNDLPAWPRPVVSDDEGRFTLRGVGRGLRVVLGIREPRFAPTMSTLDTDPTSPSKSVTIALEPARIIAGRITDAETGRPIAGARFLVLSYKDGAGYLNLFEADDLGRFRMNPLSADRYQITASSPPGQPYLDAETGDLNWPKGAVEHRVDLVMHRGVVIRGRVVEEGTGRPIAGARVSFEGRRRRDETTGASNARVATAPDGSFQLAVVPAPGQLVVLGPSDDYVYRPIDARMIREGRPGGGRYYAHALVAHDPKPGVESPEVTVPLRRGGTVTGRVIGPGDRTIPSAMMIGRVFLAPAPGSWLFWRFDHGGRVRDGRFEIHGLDPDAKVPISFFEPESTLGATVRFSGKSGPNGPVTVRLEPCGTAKARLVDDAGKPVAGFRGRRLISMIVTPGAPSSARGQSGPLLADEAGVSTFAPTHYGDGLVSDADGRIALPALIPGASYRVDARTRDRRITFRKEFTVKPGETIDLGEILIEKPPG